MTYTVVIGKAVEKDFKGIPSFYYDKIKKAILDLAEEPRPHGCKKLKGSDDTYRIRVGTYRVVYTIEDKIITVTVISVSDRKDAYR